MTIEFRSPREAPPTAGERAVQIVLGLLQLVLVGMLLYLRYGPVRTFLTRMEERGAEIPAWLPLVFTFGVVILAVFLCFRALGSFRKARSG